MKPIRLTELPATLHAAGYCGLPTYRVMYTAAIDGVFPAKQINRIWHSEIADLADIAGKLGLRRVDYPAATTATART
jgi:hypothetical protein